MHRSKLCGFIIDCEGADLPAAAAFWGGALGLTPTPLPDAEGRRYTRLTGDPHGLHIEVQRVEHPSRVHLDIETDDLEAEVRRLEALGAKRVARVESWWVLEAPTGQRFCVVNRCSPDFDARATRWDCPPPVRGVAAGVHSRARPGGHMLVACISLASAGELESFVGGGVSGGVVASTEAGFASADGVTTQAELDAAVGWGWGHARVDLDVHFDPNVLGQDGEAVLAYPSPWPEWAMVQFGRQQHIRLGLLNPNIGLEDWDPWVNYAPTYSNNFTWVGSGRFLGADVGITTASGYDLFVFGGYDVDWSSVGGGVGVATLQDSWSTWSGIVLYPQFAGGGCPDGAETCFNGFAQLAVELYPADPLWVSLEAYPGVKGGSFFTSTQAVVNVAPEAAVNPFLRGEWLFDPDRVTGAPGSSASLGARTDLPAFLRVMAEAKATFLPGGVTDFGGALTVAVHRPEPSPYSFTDPFGAEEE
jgi:predicted enzyme related to lactoylglutathione lyase